MAEGVRVRDTVLISVVIPTYNRARLVRAAVESVLAQTYPKYEIVVVDDGSTDGTGESLQHLVSRGGDDSNAVRYCYQPNLGQSAARNRGISEARGELIAFLDSDDVWLPEKLEWQVRAIEQFGNRCGACFTDASLLNYADRNTTSFREEGRHYGQEMGIDCGTVRTLARSFGNYWVSALLARTALVRQIGGFDCQIRFAEDHDFTFRLSLVTSFCYVNYPLVRIDRSVSPPGSTCRPWDKVDVRLQGQQAMFEKWLRLYPELPRDVRRSVVKDLRALYSSRANWCLANEDYGSAHEAVAKAMQYEVTPGLAIKWILTRFAPALARRVSPRL